ncbi:MAG: aminopeptidase P family N-terminal domain-containing protein, partial [Xanthomonadales bacterium]
MNKREFLQAAGAVGVGMAAGGAMARPGPELADMTVNARPITPAEHERRIEKAQSLMQAQGIDALLLEAGSALTYFTGVRWWRSERFTGAIIPVEGEIALVTPYFEEPSVRESMAVGDDVRTWHEHQDPYVRVAEILADRGLESGRLAIEETVRYFIVDGVRAAARGFDLLPGDAVTRGCRMFKSPAELALMQLANDVTLAAYRHVHDRLETGMRPAEISALMNEATRTLGGEPAFAMVLLNEASAYPH